MRNTFLRLFALTVAMLTILYITGCSVLWGKLDVMPLDEGADESGTATEEETTTPPTPIHVTVEWEGYLDFSDEQKQEIYNALVKLISNEKQPIIDYTDRSIAGYVPPRPDEPGIEQGFELGLFDVTLDGVPELLVNIGGGSSGNCFYYIYDVMSGENIGSMLGGSSNSWGVYLDFINGEYETIGRFSWRSGDKGITNFVQKVEFDEKAGELYSTILFRSEFEYKLVDEIDENGNRIGYALQIEDVYLEVDGKENGHEGYHYALEDFDTTHSLIPQTGLQLVRWSSVKDEGDDLYEKAEKMAKALVYESEQKFVKTDI